MRSSVNLSTSFGAAKPSSVGQIRVGKVTYVKGKRIDPKVQGFTSIVSLTKSTKYGDISPYCLATPDGRIMENVWQAAKVYEQVPKSTQKRSRFDPTVIWDHPAERHAVPDGVGGWTLTPEYMTWRQKLMFAPEPVRYPVGFKHRHKCLFAAGNTPQERLGYIESRKQLYVPMYNSLVRATDTFKKLQSRHQNGENLLIIEVDGPHAESLEYYKQSYGVDSNFIKTDTILCTPNNLSIMLEDAKHPFGHGYCLAMSLRGLTVGSLPAVGAITR